MTLSVPFKALQLNFSDYRTYVFGLLFVAGNVLLPFVCHLIPEGGKMFLPIYFFTLIGAYKFGIRVGLLTAILSPLLNHLLFGMPTAAVLPVLLVKSSLLAIAAAWMASKARSFSLWHIALVVIAYQLAGGLAEWGMTGSFAKAVQDFRLGLPGIIFQIVAGWAVLRLLAKYKL